MASAIRTYPIFWTYPKRSFSVLTESFSMQWVSIRKRV
jgi:hypothetical protein